jgi:phage tail sheath gpL-like
VEVWIAPQVCGGTAASGVIAITHVATANGKLNIRIAGELYQIDVTTAMSVTQIGDAIVDAMLDRLECPLTGVNTAGSVALTCKTKGTYGNDIAITMNEGEGEETPVGVTYTITPMASGATDPDIQDVLDELGTGDSANEQGFTKIVACYGRLVAADMLKISTYCGAGNVVQGCWAETVRRPFVAVYGDTAAGSDGFDDLVDITDVEAETNRSCCVIAVPGSSNHPTDIAAQSAGDMARTAIKRAEESYIDHNLVGIMPGAKADRWTSDYTMRDAAVRAGISPTRVVNGTVKLQNVVTFYRPEAVAPASNGWRSVRSIQIAHNMQKSFYDVFNGEKWKGISIVENVASVGSITSREKVRDKMSLVGDLFALIDLWQDSAWVFSARAIKERMGAAIDDYVQLRSGGTGFDTNIPAVLSGEGGIINGDIFFDINIGASF